MIDMVERRSSSGVSTNENENEVEDVVTESFINLGLLCKFFQWILNKKHGLSMIYIKYI